MLTFFGVKAPFHKNLQLQFFVVPGNVYESLYRNIHGSTHLDACVSYMFVPEIEKICIFDCADTVSARIY
jgi:hypothetical protein